MKVIVTGGVTGGHIYPALAVAEAVRKLVPEAAVIFVGGRAGLEARIVPRSGMAFHGITSGRIRKLLTLSTIPALVSGWRGYREAGSFLQSFRPNVVIGTGGYVASATIEAAVNFDIPTVILEPNAASGRMNRLLAPKVTRICIAYEENRSDFPPDKTLLTGVPIREGIVSRSSPTEARQGLGVNPDAFTLLIAGGSQGAQSLNEIVMDTLPLLSPGMQVLHQTGEAHLDEIRSRANSATERLIRYEPRAYFDGEQMPMAYRAADIIVCRCGTTLAEVTANGIPALMVPLPSAYADHQTANARAVERAGGGVLLPQASLTPRQLADEVNALAADTARRDHMAAASRSLGRPDAARKVAEIALEIARSHE